MRLSLTALAMFTTALAAGPVPDGVFRPWDGAWRGTFEVRTPEGDVTTRLEVAQIYESESDVLQRAIFCEVDQDGQVVTARAENRREGDLLICEVDKSDGEHVVHTGRSIDGALVWHRRLDDGTEESFVERIAGDEYQIDGAGVYGPGRDMFLFRGRYRRIARDQAEAWMSEQGVDAIRAGVGSVD